MTYYELKHTVSKNASVDKKTAEKVVEEVFTALKIALERGDRVHIPHFGTFFVKVRKSRKGRNPRTGEEIKIPAKRIPVFSPAKTLKEVVETNTFKEEQNGWTYDRFSFNSFTTFTSNGWKNI